MLSPAELRGLEFKRVVRSAAALQGVFDDASLAREMKRSRRTVQGWWLGAVPEPSALRQIAEVTALDLVELTSFAYHDGPRPRFPEPGSVLDSAVRSGIRQGQGPRPPEEPPEPAPSIRPPPRDTPRGSP